VALHTSWRINNSTVPAGLPESDWNVPSVEAVEGKASSASLGDSAASQRTEIQEVPVPDTAEPVAEGELFHVEQFETAGVCAPSAEVFQPDEVQVVEFVEAEAVQTYVASDSLETAYLVEKSPELHEEVRETEGVAAQVSIPEPTIPDPAIFVPVSSDSVISTTGEEDVIAENQARSRKGVRKAASEGAVERLFPNQVTPVGRAKAAEPEAPALVKDKGPLSLRMKRWLNGKGIERRKSTRLSLPGLIAFDATSSDPQAQEVGDVSPSGLYLRTKDRERWPKGEFFSLTLETRGATEKGPDWNVEVRAGAVRWDDDGVGLSFKLPKGVEFHPWHGLHERRTRETEAEYFVREFRLAQALGFLGRISPPAQEEIKHMLYERLSNKRVANAVAIAFATEKLLAKRENAGRMKAHPSVVVSIIENGSWAEIDWVQQLWAGLLVTSCTADGQDESNLVFADLLSRMTPIHLRILSAACRKGAEVISSGGSISTMTLYCTAEELIEATGSHSLLKIQQTIAHLSTFGLLAESARSSYIPITEKTKTTPTTLGLQMHARCHGRR
jgi:hypothetical protein